MAAIFVRDVAPGVAARLVGPRDRPRAPYLFAGRGVERREHARFGAAFGLAAPARDDFAVRDDRPRAVLCAAPVVENLGFPRERAGARVERVREVVGAIVENQVAVDREVAVDRRERDVVVVVVLHGPPVFPDEIAGRRVDGLRDVVRVREEHHAVMHERCAFLHALAERPRPDEAELRDVARVDLRERAVAPMIQRAAPRQPVGGVGILQHGIGDGPQIAHLCGGAEAGAGAEQRGEQGRRCETHESSRSIRCFGRPAYRQWVALRGPPHNGTSA